MIASFTACSPEENGLSKKENAKTNDEIKTIQLTTGQGRYEEFDENTYATYISESHPVVYLYYGDENKYSDLANALYDKKTDTISGTKTLYTGDKVVYIATDGESRGLLKCEDGTILCMEYKFDEEKFYMTVNGIKIEEILDGVVYAG